MAKIWEPMQWPTAWPILRRCWLCLWLIFLCWSMQWISYWQIREKTVLWHSVKSILPIWWTGHVTRLWRKCDSLSPEASPILKTLPFASTLISLHHCLLMSTFGACREKVKYPDIDLRGNSVYLGHIQWRHFGHNKGRLDFKWNV